MEDQRTLLVKRCVDCGCIGLAKRASGFECLKCRRDYPVDSDGILHAMPKQQTLRLPFFYNSPEYLRWVKIWEGMIHDWIIYKNKFYRWFSMSGPRKIIKILQKLSDPNKLVIDLGCGHGQLFSLLNPAQCIGLDSNLEFLRILKKRFPKALAIHGDFINTPFSTGSLKYVVSLHTLEHLYFLAEALAEVKRILDSGGNFLFSIPTEGGMGWELGRRLVTGPHMKRKYNLKIKDIMDIEHINDARRVMKFLKFYFRIEKITYAPFSFLPNYHLNSSISGIAHPHKTREGEG